MGRRERNRMADRVVKMDELPIAADVIGASGLAPFDPATAYPSYRSFDEFIDVERLRSLDGYIRDRIRRHMLRSEQKKFYTGPYRLNSAGSDRPGSRMIYLAESGAPDSYYDLDRTELWKPSRDAHEFQLLMDLIATLPFKSTGRILVMYDDEPREVPAHRDHVNTGVLHEFVWMRTNLNKRFYVLDHRTGGKKYLDGYSAWFDTVNQFHGCDGCDGLSFSIRVDGKFTGDFRAKIPKPPINPASTPSYWASKDEQGEMSNGKGPHDLR